MEKKCIVFQIDHKGRDLMGAALMAHHLENLGYEVHLEPLQAFKSVITAWKPSMVIVNQLVHSNMTAYSANLKNWGILVGCILNEGLALTEDKRKYLSIPQYDDLHCDLFLTWNTLHRDELIQHEFVTPPENAVTVGCPRFDFYKMPWSKLFLKNRISKRINVLINTTFAVAHFYHRTEEEQKTLIAGMGNGKIKDHLDYKSLIKAHYDGLNKLPEFLTTLLDSDQYNITLRPHPREELSFYTNFIESLPENQQSLIRLDKKEHIQSAILNSDVILNCENCTTSVESWMANKPTITLTFAKHPAFFSSLYADRSPQVSDPAKIIEAIQYALDHPDQEEYQALREEYLEKWLYKVDGQSAQRAAEQIHRVIQEKNPQPKFPKDFTSLRRGLKLRILHLINEPSHAKPNQIIKRILKGEHVKQTLRYRNYLKAVRPSEAKDAVDSIKRIAPSN